MYAPNRPKTIHLSESFYRGQFSLDWNENRILLIIPTSLIKTSAKQNITKYMREKLNEASQKGSFPPPHIFANFGPQEYIKPLFFMLTHHAALQMGTIVR